MSVEQCQRVTHQGNVLEWVRLRDEFIIAGHPVCSYFRMMDVLTMESTGVDGSVYRGAFASKSVCY